MVKYISFGKFDSLYKYMLFFIIAQLLDQYLFQRDILGKIKSFDRTLVYEHKLIQEMCNFIGIFFFSALLLIYEKYIRKGRKNLPSNENELNLHETNYIYNRQVNKYESFWKVLIIIFLLFLERELLVTFYKLGLMGLDFWMFEMLFIYIISTKIMKIPAYKHHKISVYFILIFCTIFKTITSILIMGDSSSKIYKTYKILIPLGIIIFLFITYLRAYICFKIKDLMDLKFISSNIILIIYGLMGTIICGISCIITTYKPCEDTIISFDEMIKICSQKIVNEKKNKGNYYYDSYIVYNEKIFKEDGLYAFGNICFIIMRIIIIYFVDLFSVLILKYLNPFFFLCARFINYFFVRIINIIILAIKKEEINNDSYFEILSQVFAVIGILVYIEFIELNFCDLNHNLKKNIINRCVKDGKNIYQIDIDENLKITDDVADDDNDIPRNETTNTIVEYA